jgi:hypothetical protein
MRGRNVIHQASECLHFFNVDFPRVLLCINDDPARVVRIVPEIDQHIDLPTALANPGIALVILHHT